MTSFSGGPSTPIEQIAELGDTIIQKLVAAGITTVEQLADMTPEELEEIPGIGEKTLERISVAVRHYFGQYEEGEVNPNAAASETAVSESSEEAPPADVVEQTEEAIVAADPELPHAVAAEDIDPVPVEDAPKPASGEENHATEEGQGGA